FQRQFNYLLDIAAIKHDPLTNQDHTIYSLRHTAICMRIILSEGQVNIFNLAKNAGTSVDQIERFYARNLPPSKEMAINLQSFGVGEHTRIAHLVCHHPIFDPYFQYKFERETIFQNFAC